MSSRKTIKTGIFGLLFVLVLLISLNLGAVRKTYAGSVNIDDKYIGYTKEAGKKIARKIGGLKTRTTSKYRTFYATGKKLVIGINEDPKVGENYFYLKNSGNKKVKLFGMAIGMKYSKVVKMLKKRYFFVNTRYKNILYAGNAATIELKLKNGKVKGYEYYVAPTS